MRNVSEIVRSTLMPISRAASGSWAVALMARPSRVLVMNHASPITNGTIAPIAMMYPRWIGTPEMLKTVLPWFTRSLTL